MLRIRDTFQEDGMLGDKIADIATQLGNLPPVFASFPSS
jgi:hypothetical protein